MKRRIHCIAGALALSLWSAPFAESARGEAKPKTAVDRNRVGLEGTEAPRATEGTVRRVRYYQTRPNPPLPGRAPLPTSAQPSRSPSPPTSSRPTAAESIASRLPPAPPNRFAAQSPAAGNATRLALSRPAIMLGDLLPTSGLSIAQAPGSVPQPPITPPIPPPNTPPAPPLPSQPPNPPQRPAALRGSLIYPTIRGFKVADNQSPVPQNRVFVTFNEFSDVNAALNRRTNTNLGNTQIYRETFGFEKTFWDGNASFMLRFPIDSITASSNNKSLPGVGRTSVGDLSLYTKFVLTRDTATGSLISSGLALLMPTGPKNFGGAPQYRTFNNFQLQPYVAFFWNHEKWFAQGYLSLAVPTDPHDVTLLFNDYGLGYYLYRNKDPNGFLTRVIPTFEVHVNTPLNHQGYSIYDPAGTPNMVDLTLGTSFQFGKRTLLTLGAADPVTGPKPFAIEAIAFLNVYF